jgi:hypothetical protein
MGGTRSMHGRGKNTYRTATWRQTTWKTGVNGAVILLKWFLKKQCVWE